MKKLYRVITWPFRVIRVLFFIVVFVILLVFSPEEMEEIL